MNRSGRQLLMTIGFLGALFLVLALSGCTPSPGGRCTNVGESVRIEGKGLYRCQTNPGERTPRWTKV
jgi:hypothetical protein